jgi:thioredoxin reductase (NADPH)
MQCFSVPGQSSGLLVVCFCAAWCDTCDGVRAALQRIAAGDATSTYLWLDIEDDAALVGEIEIENFPTLAVYRDGKPLFFGVSPPQEGVIARTLRALASNVAGTVAVPDAVARLPAALGR